jgi:hypothetical protein
MPPSNKIIATAREIKGWRRFPKSSSGFNQFNVGPAIIPANSKNKMAGSLRRQAIHWQKTAMTGIAVRVIRWVSVTINGFFLVCNLNYILLMVIKELFKKNATQDLKTHESIYVLQELLLA